jgi:hypothetical protein
MKTGFKYLVLKSGGKGGQKIDSIRPMVLSQWQNAIPFFIAFIIPVIIPVKVKTPIAEKYSITVTIPSSLSAKLAIILHAAVITIRHPTLVTKEFSFPGMYLKLLKYPF